MVPSLLPFGIRINCVSECYRMANRDLLLMVHTSLVSMQQTISDGGIRRQFRSRKVGAAIRISNGSSEGAEDAITFK